MNICERIRRVLAAIPKFQQVMLKDEEMFADNDIFLDSMEYITLIVNIENEFDIEIEDEDLYIGFDSILGLKVIILKYCEG